MAASGPPIIIRGGRVLDPSRGVDGLADVAIDRGVVAAIGPSLSAPAGAVEIDAEGMIVTPGLIDPHVHLREPGHEHKETIATGTRAAVAGGFTSVCCMPNTSPPIDTPETVRFVMDRARETGECRVFAVGALTKGRKGEAVAELELMSRAGAAAFSDDGDAVPTAGVMSACLSAVRATGKVLMQHCQDATMTGAAPMHAGMVSARFGVSGWSRAAEEVIIERDLRLNRRIGCRYHVQHISSAESVDLVRQARHRGERVSAEASPHHLLLTDADVVREGRLDTLVKVNPPVRERSDLEAIVRGVAEGVIDVLATDHAPHAAHEKAQCFEDAPMGMVGLETALGCYIRALVDPGVITWARLVELLTINPARLCGLDAMGLGSLAVGGPADVTIIDPEAPWTVVASRLAGLSKNTPFDGWELKGRAVATIVAGEIRWSMLEPQRERTDR